MELFNYDMELCNYDMELCNYDMELNTIILLVKNYITMTWRKAFRDMIGSYF